MKKIALSLLACLLFTACGNNGLYSEVYTNTKLGIQFNYWIGANTGELVTLGNTILYKDSNAATVEPYSDTIAVFQKDPGQSIEEAILRLVQEKGKDPTNCTVVNKGSDWGNANYTDYVLDLANPDIVYTQTELDAIAQADKDAAADGGPFNGDWEKKAIYNDRLVAACSDYADPLGLGTSKSTPSVFVYNNKSEFVFLPGTMDSHFYDENSLKLTR